MTIQLPEVEHDWSWGVRCRYCAIQKPYFERAIAMLNDWPRGEKGNKEWTEKVGALSVCPKNPKYHANLEKAEK